MFQDLRIAWRVLAKKPGFTLFAVALIALGVGANTAVFSILNAVLLRPLPFHEPDRLVAMGFQNAERIQYRIPEEVFRAWRERSQTLETITSWRDRSGEFTIAGETDRVSGEQVSANFFDLLGVAPLAGRGFFPADELPGADPVLVVSYRFWQQRLGGDPEVLGRVVYHDGMPFTIVGVMPPEFFGPMIRKHHEFWTPTHDPIRDESRQYGHHLFARLKPGVEVRQAEAELGQLARGIEIERDTGERTPALTPLGEFLTDFAAPALVVLMLAVAALLLMVCANLAQLLLARSQARVREFAARKALGATPWRVFRHVVSEGLLLALTGGMAGVLLAYWLVPLMLTLAPNLPRIDEAGIDYRVLAFCTLATLLTTILFSLAPGLRLARTSVSAALRGGGRGPAAMRLRAGSVLLVVQVGVSLMLLVSAGLLMQTFLKLLPADPGFDHSGFLTQFVLDEKRYPDDAARISFSRELLDNLEARPEIEAIALSSHIPFGWNVATVPFRLPGERTGTEFQGRRVFRHLISAGYFQVMGIPLLQGRTFSTADRGAAPPVAVVNEAFAQLLSPEGTVLGQTIFVEDNEGAELPREIVGVVANTRTHGRSTVTRESIYLPFEQQANRSFFVLLHSRSGLDALAPLLREQVRLVDPAQPVREVQAYDDLLWESVSTQRFRATLLGVFSAQALLVAVVGLFGLVSYSLAQRTPEFGVRLAVGADGRDLVRLLLRQGATLAAAGIALGAGASLFATRLLESQLYELSPGDPLTLAAAAGLLGLAALAACYLPARRAARIDPIEALRHE